MEDARKSFSNLQRAARGNDFLGVMIYPMLPKSNEIILGFSYDQQFGPVVVLGMGGIFAELLKDISIKVAPLSFEKSMKMICGLKGYPILAGSRGQKPSDLNALAHVISSFSKLPFEYPQINEVDLNPVFVNENGVLVADVRVILKEQPKI